MRFQFVSYMSVLRIRFRTVNKEINKIAKLTEVENKHCLEDTPNEEGIKTPPRKNSLKKRNKNNKISNLNIFSINPNEESNNNLPNMVTTDKPKPFNITKPLNLHGKKPKIEYTENEKHYLKIRSLADIHDKLCLDLYVVNSIFSLQLLLLVGIEFVLITATLYNEYRKIDGGFENTLEICKFFADFMWNLMRCAETLMIIWICSNTCYHVS